MTNTPVTTEEKMEVATAYVKKMRKLMLARVALVCLGLSSVLVIRNHTGLGFIMLGTGGMGAAVLKTYSTANLYCPFCGERFGYWTSRFEILPVTCPKCNERIKY